MGITGKIQIHARVARFLHVKLASWRTFGLISKRGSGRLGSGRRVGARVAALRRGPKGPAKIEAIEAPA